jgi:hypothetical protein
MYTVLSIVLRSSLLLLISIVVGAIMTCWRSSCANELVQKRKGERIKDNEVKITATLKLWVEGK